jgi:hypothetical protein
LCLRGCRLSFPSGVVSRVPLCSVDVGDKARTSLSAVDTDFLIDDERLFVFIVALELLLSPL